MKGSGGNGSGTFNVSQMDMGGWVRIFCPDLQHAPADLPVYLSQSLSDWFRERPNFSLQFAVPMCNDGDTVELHGFYHVHVLPRKQGPQPVR